MMAADAAVGPTDRPRPTLAPHTAIRSYNDNGQKNREQLRRGTSARSPSANLCGPLDLESKLVRRLVGSFIGETEHNKYIHRRRPSLFFLSFYIYPVAERIPPSSPFLGTGLEGNGASEEWSGRTRRDPSQSSRVDHRPQRSFALRAPPPRLPPYGESSPPPSFPPRPTSFVSGRRLTRPHGTSHNNH